MMVRTKGWVAKGMVVAVCVEASGCTRSLVPIYESASRDRQGSLWHLAASILTVNLYKHTRVGCCGADHGHISVKLTDAKHSSVMRH